MAAKDQTTQKGKNAADQAQEKTKNLAHQAQEQVRGQASEQKKRAAHRLSGIAQALHQTGDNLREEGEAQIAQYADRAAGQVNRASGYLNERSTDELFREAERFARRQPGWFLGGAFALGLMGARFFKSSGSDGSASPQRSRETQSVQPAGRQRESSQQVDSGGRSKSRKREGAESTDAAATS